MRKAFHCDKQGGTSGCAAKVRDASSRERMFELLTIAAKEEKQTHINFINESNRRVFITFVVVDVITLKIV